MVGYLESRPPPARPPARMLFITLRNFKSHIVFSFAVREGGRHMTPPSPPWWQALNLFSHKQQPKTKIILRQTAGKHKAKWREETEKWKQTIFPMLCCLVISSFFLLPNVHDNRLLIHILHNVDIDPPIIRNEWTKKDKKGSGEGFVWN